MKHNTVSGKGSSLLVSTPALITLGAGMLLSLRLNAPLVAGLCFFFLLLGLLCRYWSAKAMQNVSIQMECSKSRLFPGQETTIRYQVENNKFLPLVWLELSQNGPEKGCLLPDDAFESYHPSYQEKPTESTPFLRQSFSFIGSYQTLTVNSIWRAKRRGLYLIDQLVARSGDGFGLAQGNQPLPAQQLPTIAVYPRQVEVDLSLFLQPQWDCAAGNRGWMEDNTVLKGNREYQAGDNWKHINWRMTAREQGLPVNLYETIQPRGTRFILDGESFCGKHEEALEHTLEILASILTGLNTAGLTCSLSLSRSKRFPATTLVSEEDSSIDEMLLHLAGFDCLADLDPNVEQIPTSPVFLSSRFAPDAALQTGSSYLLTYSGAVLPPRLLSDLDPGKTWILSLEDSDAPARLGFRCLSLDSLYKGGSRI